MHECYDCDKCKANFKSQEDIYRHANKCELVVGPYMSHNCNHELISKAGLTEHIEDKPSQSVNSYDEPCKNDPNFRFLKAKKCLFKHGQLQDEPWKTVQQRRQRRQAQVPSQQKQFKQMHMQAQHQQPRQIVQPKGVCRNCPGCIFQKHNKCNFTHPESRPTQTHESRGGVSPQSGISSSLRQCKFGNKYDKGVNCGFLHLPLDFLPKQGGRRRKKKKEKKHKKWWCEWGEIWC